MNTVAAIDPRHAAGQRLRERVFRGATLAAALLVLLLLGGMIFPLSKLPSGLRTVAQALPAGALSDALHGALTTGGAVPARAWVVLAAWAVAAPLVAARTFRWE